MIHRFVASLATALLAAGMAAASADPVVPAPSPAPAGVPSASPDAAPASSPEPAAVPAGVVPATLDVDVTGTPATQPDVLEAEIRAAIDRATRPTLQPGSAVHVGPIVPWPLLPVPSGTRAAVAVTVDIEGSGGATNVSGVTTVTVTNVPVPHASPQLLFLSDDPEYVGTDGLIFRGDVSSGRGARLYYYHSDVGVPRDLDVVITAAAPSRVYLVHAAAGPDLDVMSVGHTVSRELLRNEAADQGTVVDVLPGTPFVLHHALLLQGELVAGAVDATVLSGDVTLSVVASPAGGKPNAYLSGPRVPYDGHNRHGMFDLAGFGDIDGGSYAVGGGDTAVRYGVRERAPRNLSPGDRGHDYGDYGVLHTIRFTLANPTDAAATVYLYEKPLGGPVRSTFVVDGQMKELGCVRLPQPYWVTTYQLPPHSTGATTTVTMPDGGSFYPLEYGVTSTPPQPYTPPVGSPDGCSPAVAPFPEASTATRRANR